MTWLAGFERFEFRGFKGGKFDSTDNWKVGLHTTEGSTISGAEATYGNKYPPHIIIDRKSRRKRQHISLGRSSYALKSSEAEDEPLIQIEMVGFADDSPNWSDEELEWLAVEVLMPIREHCPFDLDRPSQGFGGRSRFGAYSGFRFTMAEWEAFSGIVGHQHAPAPDKHWDPGALDVDKILSYMNGEFTMSQYTDLMAAARAPIVVTALYDDLLKREPDPGGFEWLTGLYVANPDRDAIANIIRQSAEFKNL